LGRHTTVPHEPRRSLTERASRRRTIRALGILVGAVAILVFVQHVRGGSRRVAAPPSTAVSTVPPATAPSNIPPPSREEAVAPLGRPAPVPAGAGRFEFEHNQPADPAKPVAWDPCRPIHYVVNPVGAPADGATLFREAIARLQTATGLHFVDDGTTTEVPVKDRLQYQPRRYGQRWAPVLIAWSDENKFPELAGNVAGVTEPAAVSSVSDNGPVVYVSGQIVFDRQQLSNALSPDRGIVRAIMLHELGHLVGLDHTSDRSEIMFSEAQFDVRDYGVGDLRGLALLGTQPCYHNL
jgi:hypothetical protein